MIPASTRELLELLLEDGPLTFDELKEFVARHPREDLFLDYKDGKLLATPKDARQTVRRWVSGFANADGGVLVLGINDEPGRPRDVSPCIDRIGSEELDTWTSKALAEMEGYFSPPPRLRRIATAPGREILLIAVARAPQLVPCRVGAEVKYYLRFHDSTPEVPPYLISDLVLGRRRHPTLVPVFEEAQFRYEQGETHLSTAGHLTLTLALENASFVFADDVEAGVVGWTFTDRPIEPLSRHLRAHVDVEHPQTPESFQWQLMCFPSKSSGRSGQHLAPFDRHTWTLGGFRLPRSRSKHQGFPLEKPMLFSCGLYVLAADSAPAWFQVDVTIADLPIDSSNRRMRLPRGYIASSRLVSSRPQITWCEANLESINKLGR